MKTRQKINPRKKEKENLILELRGNLFKIEPFKRLYFNFPFRLGKQILTRDVYTNKTFNLIHTHKGKWYGVFYISELDMYLLRKLEWLDYKIEKDIKYSHLYGRKKRK